ERLGDKAVIGGAAGAPGAAMDEDRDRPSCLPFPACREGFDRSGGKDIKPPYPRGGTNESKRVAHAFSRPSAVGDAPLGQLVAVRRVDELIVGVVERLLIHVEPDDRPLGSCRIYWRGRCRSRCVHCTSFPSSRRPNTICSAANPATAKRPTGCKPS